MRAIASVRNRVRLRGRFVVHEHEARAHHFDLRLEKDGVLKSWAVPIVFPIVPGVRRLAIQVEDHPLADANFEGIIPPDEHGAATVRIWDAGTYELVSWQPRRIVIRLAGRSVAGRYRLVRFEKGGPQAWLLMKLRQPGNFTPMKHRFREISVRPSSGATLSRPAP